MKFIEIVELKAEHLPELVPICKQAFPDGSWNIAKITSCFKPNYRLISLLYQGNVVGFAIVHGVCDEAELCCIAIAKPVRGQGYGSYLLGGLIADITQQHYQQLLLEVRGSNQAAISLYQRHGFAIIAERKAYYTNPDNTHEDALVMKKVLNS